MSKLIRTTFLALVAAVVLIAFRGPDQQQPKIPRVLRQLPREPAPDTSGTAVSIDSAQYCINRYEKLMKRYGFTRHAGERVNIRIKKTRMITIGEVFSGKRMLDWLLDNDSLYRSSGKTLQVKVELGVYDDAYLKTYHPNDSALRVKYKDRVAIFLMPVDSAGGATGSALKMKVMSAKTTGNGSSTGSGSGSSTGSGGGKALDLGGIQP